MGPTLKSPHVRKRRAHARAKQSRQLDPRAAQAATATGMDSDALCQSAGIDLNLLSEPGAQFSPDVTAALWQRAVQASLDPALGLRVSRFVSPTAFHALGYTLVASGSLREVFERIVRYRSMAEDSLELDFRTVGERYEFRFGTPPSCQSPVHELLDAFAAIYVRTCRNRLGRGYAPLAVHLQRPAPDDPRPGTTCFAHRSCLRRRRTCWSLTVINSTATDDGPVQLNGRGIPRGSVTVLIWEQRVRSAIETLLPDGEPTVRSIAEALHLSPRNLQRHLADEGCCYDLLLNQCRQNTALLHMNDQQSSLSEIAYLLGFSDTDCLSRAFKRWTGLTPEQYRSSVVR